MPMEYAAPKDIKTGKNLTAKQIKEYTLELYDQLPQDCDVSDHPDAWEARIARTDIRDKIVELNTSFLFWVASRTNVHNTSVSFEDKCQSSLCQFMDKDWAKFKWQGHYRCDLSFSVFFYLRISEKIDRELTAVKYSQYKPLQEELGKIVGKNWMKTTYDDLKDPRVTEQMSGDKIESLQAIFGAIYPADLETQELFIPSDDNVVGIDQIYGDDKYNDLETLVIKTMIDLERKLTISDIRKMSRLYSLDIDEIQKIIPKAEEKLHRELKAKIEVKHYNNDL